MKPKRYIQKFRDLLHEMTMDGLIDKPDKWSAVNEIELAVHKLEQAFEQEIGFGQARTNWLVTLVRWLRK